MRAWLKQWLVGPARPAPRLRASTDSGATPGQGAFIAVAADDADQASAMLAGVGLRRPLIGRNGQVAGFEWLLTPTIERRWATRGDSPAAAVYYAALLAAAASGSTGGRAALLRLPLAMLARPKIAAAATPGMHLCVDELAAMPAEAAAALRARGVKLGLPDGPPSAGVALDFVVVQASAGDIDTLLLSAQRWREALPGVAIVGLGLDHLEDIESALRWGITLAGGQLGRNRSAPPPRPLGAAVSRICGLLNQLAQDRDTRVIAEAVRGDAALTYRLLRYANSPAIGLKRGVETVDAAVQLLGRSELQRWLTVQLMSTASARQATRALEEAALVRGRVLEAVARSRGETDPGAHFTLGLLSLIEPLLQLPLADALTPLRLGADASDALLKRQGPWAARLELLEALDSGDAARADALAQGLGVQDMLTAIVDDAWGWSSQVKEPAALA